MLPPYETIISTKKRIYPIVVSVIWLGAVISGFSKRNVIDWVYVVFGSAGVLLFLMLLWQLFGSVKVVLNTEKMILQKRIFGIPFYSPGYPLGKVEMPHNIENPSAESSGSFMGINIADNNYNLIVFYYDQEEYTIGEGLKPFKAPMLVHEIKMRQAQLKRNSQGLSDQISVLSGSP